MEHSEYRKQAYSHDGEAHSQDFVGHNTTEKTQPDERAGPEPEQCQRDTDRREILVEQVTKEIGQRNLDQEHHKGQKHQSDREIQLIRRDALICQAYFLIDGTMR